MIKEELLLHLRDSINRVRSSKNWEEHIKNEAQASLIEEVLVLPQVMLGEEIKTRKREE